MGVDQAAGVARAILGVAGDGVVGIYRYGSAVDGGLRPASDIDVLAVVRESLTPGQRATLVARLRADREGDPACRPVEMTIVVRSQVVPWHYPPIADLAYGEWFPADHAWDPAPCPHLAVELTQVLAAYAVPLAGPPPGNLLDPVPRADLVRSGRDAVPGLRAETPPEAVLTEGFGHICFDVAGVDAHFDRLVALGARRPAERNAVSGRSGETKVPT